MMKRRIVSLILILLLSITSILVPVSTSAADADLILNESYNQYVTNEVLYDITSSSLSQYVREYKEGEKGLFLSTFKTGGSVTYSFTADSNIFVTFDVMSTADNLVGTLKIADASNQATTAIKFARHNQITTANGRHIGGYSKNGVTNVGIAVNNDEGKFDLYINRKCIRNPRRYLYGKISESQFCRLSVFHHAPGRKTSGWPVCCIRQGNLRHGSCGCHRCYQDRYAGPSR